MNVLIRRDTEVPGWLKTRWLRALEFSKEMQLRVMLVFREGNQVADFMASSNRVDGVRDGVIPGLGPFNLL